MIGETVPTPVAEIAPETVLADATPSPAPAAAGAPKEIGGRDGPDPVRYGDWEKNGRCIDF
ncbi:MAG: DUF1674 domain-containing protein [Lysobacteraceae bacterium]|nr:MAG: DUF1674 domain-containing protein [Xanthomonadaceae bacterium]